MYHCRLYIFPFRYLPYTHQLQPPRFVLKGGTGVQRGLRVKYRYRPSGSTSLGDVLENSPLWIIAIFSGRDGLNGKGGGGPDVVCVCVPARVAGKLERRGWWHLHEWVNLLLPPPHTTAVLVLLWSGGLTAGAVLSETHERSGVGAEKAKIEGVQAVTVNINGDGICGINVAHLGGRSREKTAVWERVMRKRLSVHLSPLS